MANPHKQELSRGLSDMKFMKRHSTDQIDFDTGGPLVDKWVVKNVPSLSEQSSNGRPPITDSYVEFEDLNQLGRFSYNSYNKEIERMMSAYKRRREGKKSDGEEEEEEDEREVSIKASDMAKRYEEMGVIAKRKRRKH